MPLNRILLEGHPTERLRCHRLSSLVAKMVRRAREPGEFVWNGITWIVCRPKRYILQNVILLYTCTHSWHRQGNGWMALSSAYTITWPTRDAPNDKNEITPKISLGLGWMRVFGKHNVSSSSSSSSSPAPAAPFSLACIYIYSFFFSDVAVYFYLDPVKYIPLCAVTKPSQPGGLCRWTIGLARFGGAYNLWSPALQLLLNVPRIIAYISYRIASKPSQRHHFKAFNGNVLSIFKQ